MNTYIVGTHLKALLMSTYNIYFHREISKMSAVSAILIGQCVVSAILIGQCAVSSLEIQRCLSSVTQTSCKMDLPKLYVKEKSFPNSYGINLVLNARYTKKNLSHARQEHGGPIIDQSKLQIQNTGQLKLQVQHTDQSKLQTQHSDQTNQNCRYKSDQPKLQINHPDQSKLQV